LDATSRDPSRRVAGLSSPAVGLSARAQFASLKADGRQGSRRLALDPGSVPANSPFMFVTFFHELKSAGVPVTLREYLTLMEAMEKDLASRRVEDFYYLSRAALIKDERNLDKFDRAFAKVFEGLE